MKHNFDRVIDRRGTHCTQWDYVEDRFGVPDLLPFTISDMDIPSPPSILKALESRVKHGIFGYTRWNHREFKGAVRRWFARRFSADIDEDWIVYSPSVIYACSKLIEMLSEEGDHIVVQTPAYDAFRPMVKALRRRWVPNELKYEKGRYGIDFADLEKKLAHPKAKILLWCSPHNPTGRVWRRWELEEMIRLCRKHRVFVISDEIHMDIVYAPFRHIPVTQAAAGHLEGVFLCTSASENLQHPRTGRLLCDSSESRHPPPLFEGHEGAGRFVQRQHPGNPGDDRGIQPRRGLGGFPGGVSLWQHGNRLLLFKASFAGISIFHAGSHLSGLDRRIPRPLHGRGVAGSPDPPGKSGDHARKRVRSEHFFLFAHECRLPPLQSA